MAARHGFRVVITWGAGDAVRNNMINTAMLPVCLTAESAAKVQDTVESDPGIVLTVDVGRGHVRAGRQILARFETCLGAGPRSGALTEHNEIEPDSPDRGETMAGRLLIAQRLLGSAALPGEVRMRLQRRLVAICDAMKAPTADPARSARRLDRLLTELAGARQPGLAPPPGSRPGAPVGTSAARDFGRREASTRARRGA